MSTLDTHRTSGASSSGTGGCSTGRRRSPGVPRPGDGPEGRHRLLLHTSEDERLDQLASWVADGVIAGHKVMHLEVDATSSSDLVAVLQQRLLRRGDGAHGGDAADGMLAAAEARGQLVVFGLSRVVVDDDEPAGDPAARIVAAMEEGWAAVRVSSQSCRAARAVGAAIYADAERRLHGLCQQRSVQALCQVRRDDLCEPALALALALHPHRVGDGLVDLTATEHMIAIEGEADVSNAELVGHVVDRWARHEACAMTLDMDGLRFLDPAAGRAMLAACTPLLKQDGAVRIRGARHSVLRVLETVGLPARVEVLAA